jgi:hypothetical protein
MNTQPTPEDEQIMNDILIQLERMKQNQKNLYQLIIFFRSKWNYRWWKNRITLINAGPITSIFCIYNTAGPLNL